METLTAVKTLYTHLICSKKHDTYRKDDLQTFSKAGKPLLAQYDLEAGLERARLRDRPFDMWRYRELLPLESDRHKISLGEGGTPLIRLPETGKRRRVQQLWLKDEALNPTGSFKARGLAMAVSKARELGVKACAIPTAGNAGGALSAYCGRAGLEAHVFMPRLTPDIFRRECEYFGAEVTVVDGTIGDCARKMRETWSPGWFDISTLKEPFRLEGKKTMGYEIAEQLDWQCPDVIVYPTGGGTGLIGIWKAFDEMEKLGWMGSRRPRMAVVQTAACAPIVRAFQKGLPNAAPIEHPGETVANGLRVPAAFGDELILDILYRSRGTALTVTDEEILAAVSEAASREGILLSPEGAAVWAATGKLAETGWIRADDSVVMINTGGWYKYAEQC
ncbi:MAG TPA: threonine synthase [Flavilitoribacter sp.]|nr:threonine synthase [Flavilitoribacter sp.]HMQ87004.1 threonine synthase [Flavilitoribacter sp.]